MADQAKIVSDHQIEIVLKEEGASSPTEFWLSSKKDPDIPIPLKQITPIENKSGVYLLTTEVTLDTKSEYQLFNSKLGKEWWITPSSLSVVITILLTSALVQNFVFTRYLGLCVFFGVSRKKETAIGMGVTFTIVGLLSGLLAWIIDRFILKPFSLHFLEIIIFIGIVAFLVQMVDTILRKVKRSLHQKFGIYVVLITTNCIILAVPLLNAVNESDFWPSIAIALGSGLGFALALFLMSCAREKIDLAPVPAIFKGLPIAFILAGLFALAFLGFSGLKI